MRILLSLALLTLWFGAPTATAQPSVISSFDHFSTGFRLEGAHGRASCDSCHAGGVFKGTPTQCAACHSQGGLVQATPQPPHHITSTNQCLSCHKTFSWTAVARVDHLEVFGSCASCHNNVKAPGQPVNHLPTTADCGSCHRTNTWVGARFTHTGITSGCASCHNGTQAIGKPANHIPASNQCESCHNTSVFGSVTRVDHLQVLGTCSSCHNNVVVAGQPPDHIPTTAECDSCHSTTSWSRP